MTTREQIEKDMANVQVEISYLEEIDEDDLTEDEFDDLEELRIQYSDLESELNDKDEAEGGM